MKVFGSTLTLAMVAGALLAAAHGPLSSGDAVLAGIDGGGAPQAVCDRTDGAWTGGCPFDESKRIVVAGIDAGGRP